MARFTGGWVKLHRRMLSSWIGRDGYTCGVLERLMLYANPIDGTELINGHLAPLRRGQVLTSAQQLAADLGWSRKIVAHRLKLLEQHGTIGQQTSTHGRIITLLKYDEYQGRIEDDGPTDGQPREQPRERPQTHIVEKERKEESKKQDLPQAPLALVETSKKKKVYVFEPDDLKAATWFQRQIKIQNPLAKNVDRANLESWANDIRLLRSALDVTFQDIGDVMTFALQDSFWKTVIQSPANLRAKWDQLTAKMQAPQPASGFR